MVGFGGVVFCVLFCFVLFGFCCVLVFVLKLWFPDAWDQQQSLEF